MDGLFFTSQGKTAVQRFMEQMWQKDLSKVESWDQTCHFYTKQDATCRAALMTRNDHSLYCCCVEGSSNKQDDADQLKVHLPFTLRCTRIVLSHSLSLIMTLKSFEHCFWQSLFLTLKGHLTEIWIPCMYKHKSRSTFVRIYTEIWQINETCNIYRV